MKKFYTATVHHIIKALGRNNVSFPTTKSELLQKSGEELIKVDFDKSVTLKKLCKDIKVDDYDSRGAFFNALLGSWPLSFK